jgi:hypothetical protein
MRGGPEHRPHDYLPLVRAIIRAKLSDAIEWLGAGQMLNVHALFPPPYYDHGYGILINSGFDGSTQVGTIHHIGA